MDEARDLLRRLERVDALRVDGAPAGALLEEVRELLTAAERWSALDGDDRTEMALLRCTDALRSERDLSKVRLNGGDAPLVLLRAGGGARPERTVPSTDSESRVPPPA